MLRLSIHISKFRSFNGCIKRRFSNSERIIKNSTSESNSEMTMTDARTQVKISLEGEISATETSGFQAASVTESIVSAPTVDASTSAWGRYVKYGLFTTAGCFGIGAMYSRYFKNNDAEAYLTFRNYPITASYLLKLSILHTSIAEKYASYDYSLYIARLAAAILSDTSVHLKTMGDFIEILQDWVDVGSVTFDPDILLDYSNLMAILLQVKSLPDNYVIYIMGERQFQISPITSSMQTEINTFYDLAKEDKDGKHGVHKLYVLSILRNIQNHTKNKLVLKPTNQKAGLLSSLIKHDSKEDYLVHVVDLLPTQYLSLIQLTNILACANRQFLSDTLMIYRLRLATKKVADDRAYVASLHKSESSSEDDSLLRSVYKQRKKAGKVEKQERNVEQMLEEEIVKAAPIIEIQHDVRVVAMKRNKSDDMWYCV